MKYFSTFSGVGGMEMLFPKDWELVGYSEWDKYAAMVHKYHTPNIQNYGDISGIQWERVPDFELLTGGSPCQDFSIAGKRAGITGKRSGLVWEYIRCLKEKKPRYFIFENVKGLLSSRNGWDFANLISAFSEEGYALWWQVLNAKDFGVPQNRERIFVVGTREGSPGEVFFEPTGDSVDYALPSLSAGYRKRRGEDGVYIKISEDKMRFLTNLECERLMGWPDGHTKYGINEKGEKIELSDSQRYKMCGNGCVPQCVQWIIENVIT